MSTKDMSMKKLNDAYYERRLRMKQKWYKKNANDVSKYNQQYYKKNIRPPSRKGSRIHSRKGSRKHSRHSNKQRNHSRHSSHKSHKSRKSPEQIDAELTMMIKRLMVLKEKNKSRIRSRK